MSLESELQVLVNNKAAIKAAIEAKNPSVAPTDVMSNWPASIASISGGGSSLPYDAEVEYLENTSSGNTDSGVECVPTIGFEIKYMSLAAGSFAFFSSGRDWSHTFALYSGTGGSNVGSINFHPSTGGNTQYNCGFASTNVIFYAALNGRYLSMTGARNANTVQTLGTTANLSIFGNNTRIYSLILTVNGVTVRDFIPVRVGSGQDAVGWLYDRLHPAGGPNGNGLYGNGGYTIGADKQIGA